MDDKLAEGIERFNRRAYFQAHEAWEDLWHDADATEKKFLGAMIQVAAALHLRFERGGSRGSRNLIVQAIAALEDFQPEHGGIDVARFHRELVAYAERLEERKAAEAGWFDRWLAPRIRRVG